MSIAILKHRRTELEQRIEQLIELLDLIDGDPDLEPDEDGEPNVDDEHSLGWSNPMGLRVQIPAELEELRREGYWQ